MDLDFRQLEENRTNNHRLRRFVGFTTLINSFMERFDDLIDENIDIDAETKTTALKVSGSIVSVVSKTDGKAFFMGSGTIIDCEEVNGTYFSTILTSASLLCNGLGTVPEDIKIDVKIQDGTLLDGQIFKYDIHYNIAAIKIQSNVALEVATVRLLDDSISLHPNSMMVGPLWCCCSHLLASSKFKLCPGEKVVALGRYHREPCLMAAPGIFSLDRRGFKFDCKELMRANCRISKSGIGGPIVNRHGEVIGITFYSEHCTPFLPMNIALMFIGQLERHGKFCRPWVGIEMANLHDAELSLLDRILEHFPDTFEGVVVKEVLSGSPADVAGVLPFDVIVQCDGQIIRSSLEFIETIMHKTGECLKVGVIRENSSTLVNLDLIVEEISAEKVNRWPLPKERRKAFKRIRR